VQLDPKLRFDNYVVGSGNRLAVAAARAVADAPGTVYNPLFVYSGSGLGKTHLMGAIGNHVTQNHPTTTVRVVTLDDILNQLHEAMARGETDRLRQRYQSVGMLLIDDVQFLTGHTETQSELLRILNALQAAKNQIVMTSDRPPSEIKDVDDRLVTRMSGGLIVDISVPDYETRTAILHAKCEERGVHFRSGVMEELGRLEFRNVRELQGALNRLIAVQAMSGDDSVRPTDVVSMLGSLATTVAAPRRSGPAYPPPVPVDTAPFETSKPNWRTQLRSAIDHWSGEGYSTASLERAVAAATPPADVDALLRDYQDAVAKLRELSKVCAEADQALASNEVFFDPDRLGDAQQLLERTKLATMVMPGPSGTFTRADYETGKSNELAVKAADAVIAAPGAKYNPLFLHGPSGVGKTHLMHAIGNGLIDRSGGTARIAVIAAQNFVDELIAALQSRTVERWRAGFRTVDALLIDDVQFVAGKERTQEELFHVFNALHAEGKQIVFTSDRAPRDLQGLEDRLRSRFEGGLLVEMRAPDKALRERLFARFLRENGWEEDKELVKELATEPAANVREIIGTVNRIVAAAELSGRGPRNSVARQAVKPAAPRRPTQDMDVTAADVLPLDAEKLIIEWPEPSARLIEELQ
jgi:chromosomal replication initiator protein DnaA